MQEESQVDVESGPTQLQLDALLPASIDEPFEATVSAGKSTDRVADESIPKEIGRYKIASLIGVGGYGRVFKAFDDQLQRHVAVKTPAHLEFVRTISQREPKDLAKAVNGYYGFRIARTVVD